MRMTLLSTEEARRVPGIRRWHVRGFEDYLIFYIVLTDRIEVIRVLQGARDIESIFNA